MVDILLYQFNNTSLKTHRELLFALYNSLMNNERFTSFGFNKVIITSAIVYGQEYSFHHNVLLSNNTTFNSYYDEVINFIEKHYDDYYAESSPGPVDIIPTLKVKVWNMDNLKNKKIKITRDARIVRGYSTLAIQKRGYATNAIKPLKNKGVTKLKEQFSTMDLETIEIDSKQVPICISLTYLNENNIVVTKLFLIDSELLSTSKNEALYNLWNSFIIFIKKCKFKHIFVHNLGSFYGYFIYKELSVEFKNNEVNTIIDNHNKFITIILKSEDFKIKILDSYRIFNVSLDDLCKTFGVQGKLAKYKLEYNNIDLFNNIELFKEFKEYAIQDTLGLYNALNKAQDIYLQDFNIDITSILSTSSLSLKIFRSKFLKVNIPILKGSVDRFIRTSYFGGGTDYYKAYGENLYYYDVNSLYPFAMLKPIPLKIIKDHKNINLELTLDSGLFGFFEAECYIPKSDRPILPLKLGGRTIYPYGSWKGVYFSEEMKALIPYGYKFKLLRGYEFSKYNLFSKYVEHFYNIKKNSSGSAKFIAKMHLNSLYGTFGRKQDVLETININNRDLEKYVASRIVKTIIEINEDKSCILMNNNIDNNILNKLNIELDSNLTSRNIDVKYNVAIASAVTSYSRIHMIPFKLSENTLYTDTDSIFTDKPIEDNLINNKELGLMKDELNGCIINEAYFLGIKQYGYHYIDNEGNRVYKSTFAGVPKNTISFEEIKDIHMGKSITKFVNSRFYKSFKDLSITIKNDVKVILSRSNEKHLINNTYLPLKVNNLRIDSLFFNKLKRKCLKLLKILK